MATACFFYDVATILFIVLSSFTERIRLIEAMDILFGIAILAARALIISSTLLRDLLQPAALRILISWAVRHSVQPPAVLPARPIRRSSVLIQVNPG